GRPRGPDAASCRIGHPLDRHQLRTAHRARADRRAWGGHRATADLDRLIMRRVLVALILVAAVTATVGGTFSTWTSTVSNDNVLGANSTFDPVLTAAPVVTGTVGSGLTLN